MLIAQITDLHLTHPDLSLFGGYDPAAALAATLAHLAGLDPRPDLVVVTGDLTEHGEPGEYAEFVRLTAGFDLPLVAIPGNHDRREVFAAALAGTGIGIGAPPFLNLELELGPLRLFALDTLGAEGEAAGLLCGCRLGWIGDRLAEEPERPALIFMHHPPFATGISFMDAIGCAGGTAFGEIVARHGTVAGILCGHVHRGIATRFAGTVAQTCPSVAWKVPLELGPPGPPRMLPERPGFQLHLWGPEGGLVTHSEYLARP